MTTRDVLIPSIFSLVLKQITQETEMRREETTFLYEPIVRVVTNTTIKTRIIISRMDIREEVAEFVGVAIIRKLSEHGIQSQILDWLKLHRYFCWRNNSGGFKKGKHFVRYGCLGSPDIIAIHKGQFVGIEVKAKGEKQSEDQLAFELGIQASGGRYILAYRLEDVIEGLK